MEVNDRELRLIPSTSLSDMNRLGFAMVDFIVSILLLYFSLIKRLPAQDQLSHHRITPLAFGTLLAGARATKSRDIGYAYTVAGNALPERYDKSASPPISESSFGMADSKRYILVHDAIKVSPPLEEKLSRLINQTVDVWFWESKIAVVEANGVKIIPYQIAVSGINQERNLMLLAAGLGSLLGIGLVLYPRLKLT